PGCARLRLVRGARGSGRRASGHGAQLRPRPRPRPQGQLFGDGQKAPQGEEADEEAPGPGRAARSGREAQLVALGFEVPEASLRAPVEWSEVHEAKLLGDAAA